MIIAALSFRVAVGLIVWFREPIGEKAQTLVDKVKSWVK